MCKESFGKESSEILIYIHIVIPDQTENGVAEAR